MDKKKKWCVAQEKKYKNRTPSFLEAKVPFSLLSFSFLRPHPLSLLSHTLTLISFHLSNMIHQQPPQYQYQQPQMGQPVLAIIAHGAQNLVDVEVK